MEKSNSRVCGICSRHFSSGKAMGGHMRSHFAKLPIPPKPETKKQAPENSADLTQFPIQSASSLPYHPKKKNTQNFRSLKHNFFASSENSNAENELGSSQKKPTRKRSKCHRKCITAADTNAERKELISIPETFNEVEIAATILVFIKKGDKPDGKGGRDGSEDDISDNNCNVVDVVDQKVFQCQCCYRVFKSAQALGGHKKVHISTTKVAKARANEFQGVLTVDLNFPAPEDE